MALAYTLILIIVVLLATWLIFGERRKALGWGLLLFLLGAGAVALELFPLTDDESADFKRNAAGGFALGIVMCICALKFLARPTDRDDLLSFLIAFAAAITALYLPPLEPPAVAFQALAPLALYVVLKHQLPSR